MSKHPETTESASEHPPALSSLKVVVKPGMPRDELWCHPAMYDLLQRIFMEADTWRGINARTTT